jgi:hypothetical protein
MIENIHVAEFDDESVAVQLTMVDPMGNCEPEGGEHATDASGQLSDTPAGP